MRGEGVFFTADSVTVGGDYETQPSNKFWGFFLENTEETCLT